jgi:hypothetical protein
VTAFVLTYEQRPSPSILISTHRGQVASLSDRRDRRGARSLACRTRTHNACHIMTFKNLLDELISFFSSRPYGPAQWLVGLLFPICGLVLAAIGWKRHQILGFLLFLISSALGIASHVVGIVGISRVRNSTSEGLGFLSASTTLAYLATIIGLWGLGYFVFRAKFAPPAKPEVYQP